MAAWVWISRYNLLDYALIHLRYASEHLELGAFDRATPIFSSSLAYDLLIAAAFWVLGSPLTTKILSLLCYFVLLLTLAWLVLRTAGFARSALADLRTRCTRTAFSICQPGGPNTSHEHATAGTARASEEHLMRSGSAKTHSSRDATAREAADRELFNRIAESYARKDQVTSSRIARRDGLLRALRPLLARSGGLGTVVDVGCGIGAQAHYLLGHFDRYIGIDQSEELVQAGEVYNAHLERVEFIAANIKSPDLPENVADTVLVVGALHHMTELETVMQSLRCIAKPGAAFVAMEPQSANPVIQVLRRIRMKVDRSYSREQTFFREDELRSILEFGELQEISIEYQGFVTPPFAQVILNPQAIFAPISRLALMVEHALDAVLRGPVRKLSWNMVASGRFPDKPTGEV